MISISAIYVMMWGYKTGTYLKSGKHLLEGRARTWSNPRKYLLFLAEGRRAIFLLTTSLTRGVCWVELALNFFSHMHWIDNEISR